MTIDHIPDNTHLNYTFPPEFVKCCLTHYPDKVSFYLSNLDPLKTVIIQKCISFQNNEITDTELQILKLRCLAIHCKNKQRPPLPPKINHYTSQHV
jgi:hypothetical protein